MKMTLDADCSNCPYCRNIPGVGAFPLKSAATEFDQLLNIGPGVVIAPTVGMFIPGYLLLITTRHVVSFSQLDEEQLSNVERFVGLSTRQLSGLFDEYLVFEHGAVSCGRSLHGACVSHAHLHLIPAARRVERALSSVVSWEPITGLADVIRLRESGYLMYGTQGRYYVSRYVPTSGQWIRRRVFEWLALETHWDWAAYSGRQELMMTLDRLRPLCDAKGDPVFLY
jgi:diadenosine tetraphosphate (Ap4A) HIT family hydrolase